MKSADYQESAASATQMPEHGRLSDFSQLIKTRLTFLVLVTTGVGFYVGARGPVDLVRLFNVLLGAALAAAGASALNQWWERDLDALMSRTRMRPVPAGRMRAGSALILGCFMALIGVVYLALTTNFLATILTALTIVIYKCHATGIDQACASITQRAGRLSDVCGHVKRAAKIAARAAG